MLKRFWWAQSSESGSCIMNYKMLLLFCQFKHSFVQPAGITSNELNRTKMQDKSNPFLDLQQVEK